MVQQDVYSTIGRDDWKRIPMARHAERDAIKGQLNPSNVPRGQRGGD